MKKSLPLVALLAVAACSGVGPSAEGARAECEERITAQLRTPSTAEFHDTSATEVDERAWRVSGVVSGQNGFGATVDMPFVCILRGSVDGEYTGTADINDA